MSMMIPVIKVRDKDTGIVHVVGTNPHDQLEIEGNAIHYLNLQCMSGTQYDDGCYEFIGKEPTIHEPAVTIEMLSVDEYIKMIKDIDEKNKKTKKELEKRIKKIIK